MYPFPVKGLENAAFSLPHLPLHLSNRRPERSLAVVTPPPPIMGQGCVGGLGSNRQGRLVGHPRGTILVEVARSGLGNRTLGRGQQVGSGGVGWEETERGGGFDFAWRREVVPFSPRRSGGGLTGGGSILSLALSFVSSNPLSFFRKYQDSRNRKWNHFLHQCLRKGGGGGVP